MRASYNSTSRQMRSRKCVSSTLSVPIRPKNLPLRGAEPGQDQMKNGAETAQKARVKFNKKRPETMNTLSTCMLVRSVLENVKTIRPPAARSAFILPPGACERRMAGVY